MAEAMLGEAAHVSRVLFPPDANTAAAVLHAVYRTRGQIWTLVVPKAARLPDLYTGDEAGRLVDAGASRLAWAGHEVERARVILTAIGAYQLGVVLRASGRLRERGVEHAVVAMLEPGRFRRARSEGEAAHAAPVSLVERLYPPGVPARVFVSHTRPEPMLGVLAPLTTGPSTLMLGFTNVGGTLDLDELLFVNGCSWAHCVDAVARVLDVAREKLLDEAEIAALEHRRSPEGVVIDARE
jgi:phosphoketolase